ncbi:MAG: DNA gyrase subunit A [Acidobacteria bacterium]|nr:MAG: DNA gyrase subunit A [Acidobacteriota bacterium]
MSDEARNQPREAQPVDIEDELKRSYLDYAMSVIIGRALPDVRDGLKPVHRRVLYGMWESGNRAGRPYKKSARIVGDVMGKYHPHGDSAIYDTLVRMAQDFSLRYPLVDGQGNFGSLDGDNPAAMRYTEVRLTRLAEEMLREDIDKDTVDWAPNYDGSEREPQVLPARLPNLLVNGSAGIAVGMATNIPPHNLREAIDAVLLLIDRPQATLEELMAVLPGPDFPTGGIIHGVRGIYEAYRSGRGTIHVRAKAEIEERGDRQRIVVTEIPYQVNKRRLLERIAELVREKRLEGLSDLRDLSDREGIRVVIDLKRGEVGEVVLNNLYKQTQLQVSFGINMLAIVDNQPRVLGLRPLLQHFLDHRKTVVIRRVRFDLAKAEHRAHVLEGLLKALDHIDEIITTIRASATPDEARANLIDRFAFSEIQAQAILDMRLQRLTGLERDKLVEEYREVTATIERLRAILGSDQLLLEEIKQELEQIRDAYGDERRTEIVHDTHDLSIEDLIADEDMVITVSKAGYVKRSPLALYRQQGRGGKGRRGMVTKDDDFVEHLYIASAHSYVLVFTDRGRVHWLKVHRIPELGPAARGTAIVNLLELEPGEGVSATVAVRDFERGYLIFATRGGTVKKTELAAYSRPRVGGIIAINIDDGDELLDVRVSDGGQDVMLATARGYAIRFPESDQEEEGRRLIGVRPMGRATRGVRGITLRPGDRVVGMAVLAGDGDLMTVTAGGYGKRTPLDQYPRQSRGGKGVINLKTSSKTGGVIGVKQVAPGDGMMLITQGGKLIRISVDDVRQIGRATQGVKLMNLGPDDRLVAMAKIVERDDDDGDEDAEDGPSPATDEGPAPVN